MALYLLDADALVDCLNRHRPTLVMVAALESRGDDLAVCDTCLAEAYSGVSPARQQRAEAFLRRLTFLSTSREAAEQAGRWRYEYARRGVSLATTDMLIAATALAHDATLITGNLRDYPMPELTLLPLPR